MTCTPYTLHCTLKTTHCMLHNASLTIQTILGTLFTAYYFVHKTQYIREGWRKIPKCKLFPKEGGGLTPKFTFLRSLYTVKRGFKIDFLNTRMCFGRFWEQQKKLWDTKTYTLKPLTLHTIECTLYLTNCKIKIKKSYILHMVLCIRHTYHFMLSTIKFKFTFCFSLNTIFPTVPNTSYTQ